MWNEDSDIMYRFRKMYLRLTGTLRGFENKELLQNSSNVETTQDRRDFVTIILADYWKIQRFIA